MLSSSPSSAAVFPVDLTGLHLLAGKGDQFAYWLTHLGEPWLCLPLLFLGRRLLKLEAGLSWLRIGIFALVLLVVVQGLKFGIDRPRPGAVLEEVAMLPGGDLKARAMPSGHSATGAFIFAILGGLLWRQRCSFLAVALGIGLPVTIGWSRIAIAAHWPSDVFFGLLIGFVLAMMTLGRASSPTESTGMSE